MKQKIVLADDHQLLLEGIKTVIEEIENTEIIAMVNNGTDLLHFLDNHSADLVLLDLNMPGQDGLKCLNIIKQHHPSVKVLIVTSYDQPDIVNEVKKLNADGYLVKNSSSFDLTEAVTCVLKGEKYYPASKKDQRHATGSSYFLDDFLKKFQLTKREVDIIRLICSEMSSKQIAAELFVSEFTVNTHRKNIFRKLDVKNVAGLMNFAKENGLIP